MIRETFPVGVLQCNCSVIGDERTREAIVVDPGDDIPRILAVVAKHGLTVKRIVVTHAHIDHIAGAAELKRLTGAPVLFHEADVMQLGIMPLQASWIGSEVPEVHEPDADLVDEERLTIGDVAATVIHTPGHTQGSVCLYLPEESLLLAGDTLFAGSVGRTDFPGGDARQLIRSIKDRLMVLPERTVVVPGHGPTTSIGTEGEENPFL
jgi:glyoxylase-like metal-dependent hydrolase (beta-lactamase superfamily II)